MTPATPISPKPRQSLADLAVRYGVMMAFLVLTAFLALTRENFPTAGNARTILLTSAVACIIAVPLGMLLQSGGVDFSVGSTLGLSVVLGGRFMSDYAMHPVVASIAVLLCAAAIGAINGTLCARWKLSPVVVTIGMLFLLRGVAFVLGGGTIRRGFGRGFSFLGQSRWVVLDIPAPVVVAAVWSAVLLFFWYRTQWGRHAHAGGIDETAALSSGINVLRSQLSVYILTSLAAGIGGLIQLSRLDSAPPVTGQNLELEILTAVLLGGVAFAGGYGSAANVIIGVLFLTVLGNGLVQFRVDTNWTRVVEGFVLVASAGFQVAIVKTALRQPPPDAVTYKPASENPLASDPGLSPLPEMSAPFEVSGITKRFGAITALNNVSFSVDPGQIVAVLGDNGAGKSTLVKTITGIHPADAGTLRINGEEIRPKSPAHAQASGIEAVQQSLGVVSLFSAAENLFLGRERLSSGRIARRLGVIDRKRQREETIAELERLQVKIVDPEAPVASLSGGQRQSVAVARASMWATSLVLLDEPTAALGVEQKAEVLHLIVRLANAGAAVILVTHDMSHVLEVCHRAVILRHGELTADIEITDALAVETLIGLITGAIDGASR